MNMALAKRSYVSFTFGSSKPISLLRRIKELM